MVVGGRHLRAALEGAGEQRFFAVHQRGPTKDHILFGMHRSCAQDVLIRRFIQVLRELSPIAGRLGGRAGRKKHFQKFMKRERSITTMRLGHFGTNGEFETTRVVVARFTTGVVAISMFSRNRSQSTQSPAKDACHDIQGMAEGAGTKKRGMTMKSAKK